MSAGTAQRAPQMCADPEEPEAVWGRTCTGCGNPLAAIGADADWPQMCQLCTDVTYPGEPRSTR